MKNKNLRASFYNKHCLVCNKRGCDPCHIKSYGASGIDEEWNLMPLCRAHHSESHSIGMLRFSEKYPIVLLNLLASGWYFENNFGVFKLRRD